MAGSIHGAPCQPELDGVFEAQVSRWNPGVPCRAKHEAAHQVVGEQINAQLLHSHRRRATAERSMPSVVLRQHKSSSACQRCRYSAFREGLNKPAPHAPEALFRAVSVGIDHELGSISSPRQQFAVFRPQQATAMAGTSVSTFEWQRLRGMDRGTRLRSIEILQLFTTATITEPDHQVPLWRQRWKWRGPI